MVIDWIIPLATLVASLASLIAVLALIYGLGRWTKSVEIGLGVIFLIHGGVLFKLYEQLFPPRSTRQPEKVELLKKLREGTITAEEGKRLEGMLRKQRDEALQVGLLSVQLL
ncbi:MAG: hypothetical protein AOA65_0461 [Candidatus Bathyarchaeota archaeon BA1]|nr:MAG: hypothetical protein AOA65_0461 [Candidatus Bathyarchaeota archaeon BA1]